MLCLLRNNAIYVVLILAFICYFIKFNKITTPLFIGIVLYFFINNAVYSFLGINEGLEKEKISVPINQLSLAYINNDFSLEDKETLNNFLDVSLIEKKYNRRFADDLKFIFRDDVYRKKKLEFYKLYIKCFVKYPYDYINAFIDLNLPYWYLQSSTIDEHSKREYLEVYVYDHDKYSFQRKNNSKILYSFYSDIANFTFFEKNIILKILNSISLPIYFIVFTLVTIIYKKKYRYIIITLPSLFFKMALICILSVG